MDQQPEYTEPLNKAKKWPVILIPLVVVLIVFLIQSYTFNNDEFSSVLKVTSIELNKTCPKMEGPDTRLDNTEVIDDKTFQYNYTLLDIVRDSIEVEMLYVSFESAMISNVKTNPALEVFRKNSITFAYSFKDKAGTFLTKILVTPEEYLH